MSDGNATAGAATTDQPLPGMEGAPAASPPAVRVEWDITPSAIAKILGVLFAIWLLVNTWPVLVVLLFSLMLVATFNPLVRRLETRINRNWAIVAVVVGAVLLLAALMAVVIPPLVSQARQLVTHMPAYASTVENLARRLKVPFPAREITRSWTERLAALGPQLLTMLAEVLRGVTGVLTVAVLTIYLLIDGPRVGTSLISLLPRIERLPARRMLAELGQQVGSYMRGQLLTSALAGLFSFVLLIALRVPNPLALAFLMALADAVPMVGPLIGTIPAVLMALTQGTGTALAVAAGYVIYHQIESHILVPRIYGSTLRLPSSVVLIAILVGAELLGILGAILALPVAAAVPLVLRFAAEWRQRHDEASAEGDGSPQLP